MLDHTQWGSQINKKDSYHTIIWGWRNLTENIFTTKKVTMQASNVITSPIYLFLGFSIPPDKISFFNWNLFFSLRLFLFIFIEKHGYVMQSEYFGSC